MLSLIVSIALFIYFSHKYRVGPVWFAWTGVGAASWIASFLAFMIVKRSKKRVLHDVEVARQSNQLSGRIHDSTITQAAMIGDSNANRQHAIPVDSATAAGAGNASNTATAGVALALRRHRSGLGGISEKGLNGDDDWARGAEERLDTPVAIHRAQEGVNE
ncbi:uncharacterized protein ColSpa_09700 [Colletotrichum spaethianum]|uniref:Uncharacterized protein n=1 Tax=Colletotrichum spaethianum TaxID=700344 RepID=A0AA37PC84_9PEZI|nr:uncharacterized protein ColSpa_09700 [Colletotrichum spaethianum]GKT49519.1 hypothetical protein ColSpa_09700 [Colletotrichum spaethianum]